MLSDESVSRPVEKNPLKSPASPAIFTWGYKCPPARPALFWHTGRIFRSLCDKKGFPKKAENAHPSARKIFGVMKNLPDGICSHLRRFTATALLLTPAALKSRFAQEKEMALSIRKQAGAFLIVFCFSGVEPNGGRGMQGLSQNSGGKPAAVSCLASFYSGGFGEDIPLCWPVLARR